MPRGRNLLRELSISLFGKWEPDRLFMIFTGRIDESDTHGPEPDIVMSALLGDGRQWELVRRKLRIIQRDYGFSIFHGTQFKTQTGEFANWSEPKCRGLLHDMGKVVAETLTECFTVDCTYATYRDYFLKNRPAKMQQVSQYGLCFIALLDAMTVRVGKIPRRNRLSVIVEDGHKNAPDAARIWKERKETYAAKGMDFYRDYSQIAKREDPLLMMVDMIAYGSAHEARIVRSGAPRASLASPDVREPEPGETGWTFAQITPGYIALMFKEFEEGKAAKHEDWLKRKAAWLASQKKDESS